MRASRSAARSRCAATACGSSSTACISVAIPRIRDFRGLPANCFDGRGNYTFGVNEQSIFPEIDYDKVDEPRGMDITIVTSADDQRAGRALLEAFGFPFKRGEDAATPPRKRKRRGPYRGKGAAKGEEEVTRRGKRWRRRHSSTRQQRKPKYKVRGYTRCRRCGRPRSVYRKFGLCRICLRELAHAGEIPGVTKASW